MLISTHPTEFSVSKYPEEKQIQTYFSREKVSILPSWITPLLSSMPWNSSPSYSPAVSGEVKTKIPSRLQCFLGQSCVSTSLLGWICRWLQGPMFGSCFFWSTYTLYGGVSVVRFFLQMVEPYSLPESKIHISGISTASVCEHIMEYVYTT